MQTVTARPRCVLVASTTINWEAIDSVMEERGLEWKLGSEDGNISDQAALAELAGRGCYNSFDGPNGAKMGRRVTADYIRHLIEVGHGSVLEHATMTFQIWGNSRGFTHELVRHRVGTAFSQASTRFRDESKFGRVIVPALLRNDPESIEIMERHAKACQQAYDALLTRAEVVLFDQGIDLDSTSRRKTARGAARAALPIGLESTIVVTMNMRTLRGFLDQRATAAAELEIREIAMMIYELAVVTVPEVFSDYTVVTLPDGTKCLETPFRKV